jgi:para-nitrobenzyl esterase
MSTSSSARTPTTGGSPRFSAASSTGSRRRRSPGPTEVYGSWSIAAFGLPVDAALTYYRARHPDAGPGDLLAAVLTDWWVRLPALRLADAHAPGRGATYVYEFAWPSPVMGGRLGACHALEIPFVFDTLDLGHKQMLGGALGQNPPQHLADTMHRAWVELLATVTPDGRATSRHDEP